MKRLSFADNQGMKQITPTNRRERAVYRQRKSIEAQPNGAYAKEVDCTTQIATRRQGKHYNPEYFVYASSFST